MTTPQTLTARPLVRRQPREHFVVVFGTIGDDDNPRILGRGELVTPTLVLADPDTVARLREGAVPTTVGVAPLRRDGTRTQARAVHAFGPRAGAETDTWGIELDGDSLGSPHDSVEQSADASIWCVMFPWLTFCQRR